MNNNFNPLSAEELTSRINKIPRVNLAQLPTVLEFAPNISKELGINLYIKRDDCTALAFGGNKTRHLEFIMAKTLSGVYDCILTGAASQSNFCRQAVAAANKLNLDSYLVLMHGIKGNLMQGNFLLYNTPRTSPHTHTHTLLYSYYLCVYVNDKTVLRSYINVICC